jgi:DNA-binding IclR family transcriptional regulator
MKNNNNNTSSSATLRALRILEIVAASEKAMTPTEINQHLDLPKPSIHRICLMLEREGYLQNQIDSKGLIPGARLAKIALKMFSNNDHFKYERHAILQNLSDEIGETCNISIPEGMEMIYYDRVETHWPFRMQMKTNARVPIYCTASGKLFLSSLSSAKRNRILSNLKIEKLTPNTITDIDELKQELKRIRKTGIGVDNEEFMQGMIAVSVPLITSDEKFIGGLTVHAPKARLSMEDALEKIHLLKNAAKQIVESIESSAS